jgi:hypothetical protein
VPLKSEGVKYKLLNWDGWLYSFLNPREAFRTSREGASLAGVSMNILVGLVNAGIIAVILVMAFGKQTDGQNANSLMGVFSYTNQFIIFLSVWLIDAAVSYSFAVLAGGMGSIKQHLYILSMPLPLSPLVYILLATAFSFLLSLHISLGLLAAILIAFYIINIQITAMKETHKFGTLQAVISGLIPVIISGGAVGLLIFILSRK